MVRFSHYSESYKLAVLRRNCKRELDSGREKAGRDEENLKKKSYRGILHIYSRVDT